MKTKIKSHANEVTNFYDRKISKLDSNHNCLAVISLDSAVKENNNYYWKMFLKECKYIEKNVFLHIHDNLSNFSYSSEESDEESIKNMNFRERNFENIYIFFVEVILKAYFFKNHFFEGTKWGLTNCVRKFY